MIPATIYLLEERCDLAPEWDKTKAPMAQMRETAESWQDGLLSAHKFRREADHAACHYEVRIVAYRRGEI